MFMSRVKSTLFFLITLSIGMSSMVLADGKATDGPIARAENDPLKAIIKISTFKDISAFVLSEMQKSEKINLKIKYVKDADEAHKDLKDKAADLVFMSYDDTLSIAILDQYADILAVMPIHGGILDLCGTLDPDKGKTAVGIDTDSGYARGLRSLLIEKYGSRQYPLFRFKFAGATNIRYEKLLDREIDATLLNPPYSFKNGVNKISGFVEFFGAYQGVVVNVNRSWLADQKHQKLLQYFSDKYYQTVNDIKNDSENSIKNLQEFYSISPEEAKYSYQRLWAADGLILSPEFDENALHQTEQIFRSDTNQPIPLRRTWVVQSELTDTVKLD